MNTDTGGTRRLALGEKPQPNEVLVMDIEDLVLLLKEKEATHREAIREVVGWISKYHRDEGGLDLHLSWQGIVIDEPEWQAFLKEWGIE